MDLLSSDCSNEVNNIPTNYYNKGTRVDRREKKLVEVRGAKKKAKKTAGHKEIKKVHKRENRRRDRWTREGKRERLYNAVS